MSVNIQTSTGLKKLSGASKKITADLIAAALGYVPANESAIADQLAELRQAIEELQDKTSWKTY